MRAAEWALLLLVPALLVAAGVWLVPARSLDAPEEAMRIRGDTLQYEAMAEGGVAQAPFAYRPAVPFLASLLPMGPLPAFQLLTYLSLYGCYLVGLLVAREAGAAWPFAVGGLVLAWASPWHLYHYHNPFLTDAAGLLALWLLVLLAMRRLLAASALALGVGILVRETALFLAPLWLWTRQWGRALALLAGGVLVFVAVRLLIASHPAAPAPDRLADPVAFAEEIARAWGPLWGLGLAGLLLLPAGPLPLAALLLGAGAFAASFLATDVGRMFTVLTPLMALTAALLLAALARRAPLLALLLALVALAQATLEVPTRLGGLDAPLRTSATWARLLFLAGLAGGAAALVVLREEAHAGLARWRESLPLPDELEKL